MKKLFLFLSLTLFFVGSLSAKDLPVASQKQVVKAALTAHVDKPSKDLSKVSPLLQKRLDTAEQTLRTKGVKQHSRFESSPTQQVVYLGRRAQTDATTASITLKAGNPWGDGTGYVLWISNNLTFDMVDATYDEVTEDYNWATIYGYCNYFIPTTATGSPTTPKVGGNSGTPSATITIPGGTYAYLVLNPDPTSNTMFIPGAGPAYDFTYNFQNGWEYLFEITADPTYGDKVNLTATHPLPPGFTYTLPFTDNFSESYANKWTITDANSDGKTWTQVTDGSVGAMRYSYNSSQNANDYLITNAPVTIPAGENTFKLSYRAQSSSYPEAFEIYYGTSNAPASFTKIGGVSDIKNTTYEEYITAVNLPAGDYYFAIKATSAKDMFYLYITDVSITAGAFVALPDLSISKIVLPQASCTLSNAESISLVVANTGLAASTSYTINYTVNGVNGSQTVAGGLAAKSTATVALNSTFDFSALTTYNITASVTDPADTNTENNSASVSLTTHGPLTLPFSNHLESEADIADFYFDEDTWVYFNTGGFKDLTAYEESPLYTRCIQMNSGVYNLKFGYMAGMNFFGYLFTDDFEVRFGKAGTDVSTWQVIASFEEEYTDDAYVNYETTLTVSSADLYQVAFVPTWLGALAIESIEITAALDHDVAVQSVTSTLAAYTPVSHLNGNTVEFSVGIKNTGKNNETVKVQVLQGATVLGEVSQTVNAGATATVKVPATLSGVSAGQAVELTAKAVLASDENLANNEATYSIHATESTFATENIEFSDGGLGSNSGAISFGNIYTLTKADQVASLSALFYEYTEEELAEYEIDPVTVINQTIGYAIYKVTNTTTYTIGSALASGTGKRTLGGLVTFNLATPLALEAGTYYFEIKQLDAENIALSYDGAKGGIFYLNNEDGTLSPYAGSSFGNIGFRANVGGAPELVSVNIADGDVDVDPETAIVVTFDRDITSSKLGNITLTIASDATKKANVTLTPSIQGGVLTINHAKLDDETTYDLLIPARTIDNFDVEISLSFTTAAGEGIGQIVAKAISVYPNPAKGFAYISYVPENSVVTIQDVAGRTVQTYKHLSGSNVKVDLPLASGVYFVRIDSNKVVSTYKLIVK